MFFHFNSSLGFCFCSRRGSSSLFFYFYSFCEVNCWLLIFYLISGSFCDQVVTLIILLFISVCRARRALSADTFLFIVLYSQRQQNDSPVEFAICRNCRLWLTSVIPRGSVNSQLSTIYYLIQEILKYLLTKSSSLSLSQKGENQLVVTLDLTVFWDNFRIKYLGSSISENYFWYLIL